ncbi:WhiB family transcriptional regulator [Streptomyces xanthochromogenes]|uniref:WhiB family transcriptional regulator n=1 Tax=Streptomyces xanthochromogenes TaxID=67384 RepID=UPI003570F6D3
MQKWKGVVVVLAWSERAMCGQGDADALFAEGTRQHDATALCTKCPVRTECLAHALDQRIEFGVWGGMTERERRALLRRRPGVASWRSLLETARTEHTHLARDRAPGPRREPGAAHQDTRGTSASVYTPS